MGLGTKIRSFFPSKNREIDLLKAELQELKANYVPPTFYPSIYAAPYIGEKTPGEMGAAKKYIPEYNYLRTYSWQAFLDSEFSRIIIPKSIKWVIGSGLKVQPEPDAVVLAQEGIKADVSGFIKEIECRFSVWSGSKMSDYSNMTELDMLAAEAYKNAIVGGDVLVILRVINNVIKVQIIDGEHVITPFLDNSQVKAAAERGNRIRYGVEISSTGEHVAYYVMDENGKSIRYPRYGEKSGALMSFLVYGNKYRIDTLRGLPLLSHVLETMKKLDRYKEATVGTAEELAKIAYWIKHGVNSSGQNPLSEKMQQAMMLGLGKAPETGDAYEAAATKIATSTQKQVFNMPIDAELHEIKNEGQLYFKDFYETNGKFLSAALGMPYEVAMAMYNSNYSASRAAIKDWEHSMKTDRFYFASQFYQPIYNLFFELNILLGKLQAPGYLNAMVQKNEMAIAAYTASRWLGPIVPHIDPLKEVTAERLKLGDDVTPLTTYDQATETLGSGDFSTIIQKVKTEQKLTEGLTPKNQPAPQNIKNELIKNVLWQES